MPDARASRIRRAQRGDGETDANVRPACGAARAALPEHLQDAWRRCQRAGLQPDSPLPAQPDSDSALYALRQRHRSLLRAASPLMARLARQLTDCGSAVLLCNADGVVLHRLGPPAFLDELARLACMLAPTGGKAAAG